MVLGFLLNNFCLFKMLFYWKICLDINRNRFCQSFNNEEPRTQSLENMFKKDVTIITMTLHETVLQTDIKLDIIDPHTMSNNINKNNNK